ncbi:uncharacterized protein LOC128174082 [Crassostrea angulata]|uniref:uncharacterized protein LOC128174082 n=1 Tax=Magallana angulata TaxID=2784310 RepID=UPI0022B1F7F6|nr:uncharacterized protein LOC128174082 [Crassostrea angulata]
MVYAVRTLGRTYGEVLNLGELPETDLRLRPLFLVVHIIHNEATVFNDVFAVRTNDYPKSTCHRMSNIRSKGQCLGTCIISVDRIVMISHDESTNTCMCCNDITGSDITGPNWKSYVTLPAPCAEGYVTYRLISYEICMKYFPVPASYSTAQANCQAEGADLIKIDSQEKYDIFKDYHVPIANNASLQVWVQGEKVGGQWQFDDGTLIPGFCPIEMSNNPGEVHFRARGSTSFNCTDALNNDEFHYSCEYRRLFYFNN